MNRKASACERESVATAREESTVIEPEWAEWSDRQLLELRLCDLHVQIKGTSLAKQIKQLHRELATQKLLFRPHCWLSDDWYCPDGIPGIAIPFYMGHPRLAKLEHSQMLEVEGGTAEWCMRILRHEAGHAIENAFRLRRRTRRQQLFGKTSEPYPENYLPKPYSKSFVLHLDTWYAQSHPDEDFAETFAVWLTPGSDWKERYKGWPALRKLNYMDSLMKELAGVPPPVTNKQRLDPLPALCKTLGEHYRQKRERYGLDYPNFYERDVRRLFSDSKEYQGQPTAVSFIRRFRKEVRRKVADWTGEYQYTIDQVLEDIVNYCRDRQLRLTIPEDQAKLDFTILLTVQTMNYLHGGGHRVVL
ncbi:MAG: putative zinc-binding metallopeptidase [Nitrospira sp.]|nr:putative zinc-binding metallopeptidase [Nitrospira sp.]